MKTPISMLLSAGLVLVAVATLGQPAPTVMWNFYASRKSATHVVLHMDATLQSGWRLYSQFLEAGGPIPTKFSFERDEKYSLYGPVKEDGEAIVYSDPTFGFKIRCYEHNVSFAQAIVLKGTLSSIRGMVEYMTCNHDVCVPTEQEFSIKLSP